MRKAAVITALLSGLLGVGVGLFIERSQTLAREQAWRRGLFISVYERGRDVPLAYHDPQTSILFYLESNSTTVSAVKNGRVIWTVTPYAKAPADQRTISGVGIANDRHDRLWVHGGGEGDHRQGYIEVQTGTFVSGGFP